MIKGIKPDFHLPSRIYIQPDIINNIGIIISSLGTRVILITTSSDFETFSDAIEIISNKLKESDTNDQSGGSINKKPEIDKIWDKRILVFDEVFKPNEKDFKPFIGYIFKLVNKKQKKIFIGGYKKKLNRVSF